MENRQEQEENVSKSILRKKYELLLNGTPFLSKASTRDRERIYYKHSREHLRLYHKNNITGYEGWGLLPLSDFLKDYDDFEIVDGKNKPTKHYSQVELRLVAVPIGSFIETPDGLTWEKKDEITYENITHGKLTQKEFAEKYNDFKIIED